MTRLWLLLVVLLVGCSKPPPPPPPPPVEPSSDDVRPVYADKGGAVDPIAQALCAAVQGTTLAKKGACCGMPPVVSPFVRQCEVAVSSSMQAGAVKLDAAKISSCQAAVDAATQGCAWVGPISLQPPSSCEALFTGTLAAGASCRSSLECAGGLRCHGVGPTDKGTCGAPLQDGSDCARAVDALAAYAVQSDVDVTHPECAGACMRGKCRPIVALGGPCASSVECGKASRCAAGKCVEGKTAPLGGACSDGGCEPGARCASGTCTALFAEGAACSNDTECRGGCVKETGKCGMRCTTWKDVAAAAKAPIGPAPR